MLWCVTTAWGTAQGKWMDGWESRRKRDAGHDWALYRLAVPGTIGAFDADTAFFTGNFPPMISIEVRPSSPFSVCGL